MIKTRISSCSIAAEVEASPYTQHVNHIEASPRYLTGSPAIVIGIVLGIGLSHSDPSEELAEWIALPGELFIHSLQLLVVPMVFASVSVAMAHIFSVGKASLIGWRMVVYFITTSIIASLQSVFWAVIFQSLFVNQSGKVISNPIGFQCNNGFYMQVLKNGTVSCTSVHPVTEFYQSDKTFQPLTLSRQLMMLFRQMIPSNSTDGSLMLAIPFGLAVSISQSTETDQPNYLLQLMRQINNTFLLLVRASFYFTPIALVSLIAGSLTQNQNHWALLHNVGFFLAAIALAVIGHLGLIMPAFFFLFTHTNPYRYLRRMIPAQFFAFASASSIATLPVTMRCVDGSQQVSRPLTRFVLSLGATLNMDGSALYYPLGIVFLAKTSGHDIGTVQLILLTIVSTIASIGGAPGLLMIISVWHTVMQTDLPASFAFLIAIDWLVDRFRTVSNITGDTILSRILANCNH